MYQLTPMLAKNMAAAHALRIMPCTKEKFSAANIFSYPSIPGKTGNQRPHNIVQAGRRERHTPCRNKQKIILRRWPNLGALLEHKVNKKRDTT